MSPDGLDDQVDKEPVADLAEGSPAQESDAAGSDTGDSDAADSDAAGSDAGDAREPVDPGGLRRSAVRAVVVVAVAAVLLALVRLYLVQSFVIPSSSMEPTLSAGDRVLVSRLDYRFSDVRRGDVIVFNGDGVFDPPQREPSSTLGRAGRAAASWLGVPVGEHDYTKRVIGLPGDRVACCDAQGRVTVNGVAVAEPYLDTGSAPSAIQFDVVVPSGRLWVMGDNRNVSGDSRVHLGDPGGGTVPLDHVVGRVVTVWWPFGSATGIGRVDASGSTGR